jgi:hypothetical protein
MTLRLDNAYALPTYPQPQQQQAANIFLTRLKDRRPAPLLPPCPTIPRPLPSFPGDRAEKWRPGRHRRERTAGWGDAVFLFIHLSAAPMRVSLQI